MSAVGSIPAAFACIACAIPISLPSRVTQELRLIFCALNGATEYLFENILHRAVTMMLFPTCDPVPTTMRLFVLFFIYPPFHIFSSCKLPGYLLPIQKPGNQFLRCLIYNHN